MFFKRHFGFNLNHTFRCFHVYILEIGRVFSEYAASNQRAAM